MSVTQTATSPTRDAPGGPSYRLLVVHGPSGRGIGRSVSPGGECAIGRVGQTTTDLVLDDAEVSRRHALVAPIDVGVVLTDARSRNGSFLNGIAIERATAAHGDVVRVGGHLLVVQAMPPASAAPYEPVPPDPHLVGQSFRLRDLLSEVQRAPNLPALVIGETGAGKELVSLALHRASRRSGPLVSVNCAALPAELAESELFGHVAGAFTGASERSGLFHEADRGSLLLDEIGDMPPALQTKLLRAISTSEIRPVGADRPRAVDVRIIAATNRDLAREVASGRFRADLFARLRGVVIDVPPLRERREDVLELAHHFLALAGSAAGITADAAEALLIHDWPFNVRELEQLMRGLGERLRGRRAVDLEDLPPALQAFYAPRRTLRANAAERATPVLGAARRAEPTAPELETALHAYAGNVAKVASHFGKDRRQIYRWARRLGVDIERIRAEQEAAGAP